MADIMRIWDGFGGYWNLKKTRLTNSGHGPAWRRRLSAPARRPSRRVTSQNLPQATVCASLTTRRPTEAHERQNNPPGRLPGWDTESLVRVPH